MKVLVDTSVWVDFFNDNSTAEAGLLTQLIEDEAEMMTCGVVIAEFVQGIRRKASLPALEEHFRYMGLLVPKEPDSYIAAASLYRRLRGRGITIRSTIDCLIAVLAEENDVLLLARDRDMKAIVESGLSEVRMVPIV